MKQAVYVRQERAQMRPHKKTLLAAACATGLMIWAGGCGFVADFFAIGGEEFHPDVCEELINGGVLDCQKAEDDSCRVVLNECTYYRLGKYRILVDLGSDRGSVYYRPYTVENYDKHSPARKEVENVVNASPDEPLFNYPYVTPDLFSAVHLKVSVFDTEERKWKYSEFSMYRAWVSPEVTYENTVWGKLRKQGDTTYAWHVLPRKEVKAYRDLYKDEKFYRSEFYGRIGNWDPKKPINWRPGEKEAHDELARHMSLSFPLAEGWEAYDLDFIFGGIYRPHDLYDDKAMVRFPEHLRRSFTEAEFSGRKANFLQFKVRRR